MSSSSSQRKPPLGSDKAVGENGVPEEKGRIGIIISMFPELHETFILRELVALERRGVDFDIYSLQFPRDPITIDDARRLADNRTYYSRLFTVATLWAFLRTLLRHPLRVMRAMVTVAWVGRDRPEQVVKNLAILPLTLHFGELGKRRGVTHWHGHWANIPTTACWYLKAIFGDTWSAAIHGEDIFTHNRFLAHKLDDTEFTVVCSGYFCKHLKENIGLNDPSRVHLNYHGLDPRVTERAPLDRAKSARLPDAPLKLVSIGRLVPTKGHDTLFEACRQLKERGIAFSLDLIGSGPLQTELEVARATLQLESEVRLVGALAFEEVLSTLEQADVFCLAPRLLPGQPPDGIPNVIAEAMALSIPVVTTRVSAIPELVEDGVSGILVDVDDASAMAQAMERLATDVDFARRLSEGARSRVAELFNQQQNINELLALFDQAVPGLAYESRPPSEQSVAQEPHSRSGDQAS